MTYTYKILIVEDDMDIAQMYKLKLDKEWFDVEIAEDGFVALSSVVEFEPDVILLDIMMPSMNWFETLKVIREETSIETKIIMFSNISSQKHIEKSLKMWADDYLIKSDTTPKEAVAKIKTLLWIWDNNQTEQSVTTTSSDGTYNCPHCEKPLNIDISIKA